MRRTAGPLALVVATLALAYPAPAMDLRGLYPRSELEYWQGITPVDLNTALREDFLPVLTPDERKRLARVRLEFPLECTPQRDPETREVYCSDPMTYLAMRDGAVYVNTARAALHDLDALVGALGSGGLSAAGLDHFEGEQLPEGHPLTSMQNVVLTPHIGGATFDTETNHSAMIAGDIARLLAGAAPVHCLNPEVLG